MSARVLDLRWLGFLTFGLFACSGEAADGTPAPAPSSGGSGGTTTSSGGSASGGGGNGGTAGATAGGAGGASGNAGTGGAAAGSGGAAAGAGGASGGSGGSGGADPSNPGNYPPPPREINVTTTDKVSISFSPADANAQASGSGHKGEFDGSAPTLQKKLVVPLGGVNSEPWGLGWAVDRGYHVITVDLWNDYPSDEGYPEYLESWSGEDVSTHITQNPANSVMARVKDGLAHLHAMDPGTDWGYYLDEQGEVRWNDVIVFGYSFGGQMGVAASKYVALHRVVITSSPNVPIDSPWLVDMPSVTPVERCYVLSGINDGEHDTHMDEAALLGWPGDVFDVSSVPPPYPSNRLEVDDGHSSFCGRPFNDGMKDWDGICEFMFGTQ